MIEKLYSDFKNHASPDQLLVSVQLLQKELMQFTHRPDFHRASKKVAVMLPQQNLFAPPVAEEITATPQPAPIVLETVNTVLEPVPAAMESIVSQPVIKEKEVLVLQPDPEPEPEPLPQPVYEEAPTVARQQHAATAELNDMIGQGQASLNERLKENGVTTEVAETLTDPPLKDLKKGIGLNDRYLYINELFRGDETMYERSIKTINSFNIYPEAQYWIERELKIKLGWNDNTPTVKQFYGLVKRRFS